MSESKAKRSRSVAGKREILAFYTSVMRDEVSDYALEGKGKEAVPVAVPVPLKMRMEAAEKLKMFYEEEGKGKDSLAAADITRMMRELEGSE
jgi:hypothetical protein